MLNNPSLQEQILGKMHSQSPSQDLDLHINTHAFTGSEIDF